MKQILSFLLIFFCLSSCENGFLDLTPESQANVNDFYNVTAGLGNGLKFWNSDNYKISMGALCTMLY